ncbi:hypothetical protein [Streptomyces violascens]|uniref:hypothetical protein n=1 Tax=Streptomyces violascens TaxID=67381 RepID=UPI0016741566|nr:hypothetical protein [Streptomyces violascens]GGU44721.1 hypothetical protein GCM10010289_76640 [Streptomyces violascens]
MDAANTPMFRCIVHPDGKCPTDRAAYDAGYCYYELAATVEGLITEVCDVAPWPTL